FLRDAKRSRIGVDELKALIDEGMAPLVIDVRSALGRSVDPRCIPQAVPLDLGELRDAARGLPRGRTIVAYCNCPNDASAVAAARLLAEAGLTGVRPLGRGPRAVIGAGQPGAAPQSGEAGGAALLVPGSLSLISAAFPEAERGRAIGTWSAFSGITAAVGPVIGGFLVDHFSWRWAFLVNLPVGAVLLAICAAKVPESRGGSAQ